MIYLSECLLASCALALFYDGLNSFVATLWGEISFVAARYMEGELLY